MSEQHYTHLAASAEALERLEARSDAITEPGSPADSSGELYRPRSEGERPLSLAQLRWQRKRLGLLSP